MATAKLNPTTVTLRLSISETAALHALLALVDEITHPDLNESTFDIFSKLCEAKEELQQQKLWPARFADIIAAVGALRPLEDDGE